MSAVLEFLTQGRERGASDVHLVVGLPATVRRQGRVEPLGHQPLEDAFLRAELDKLLSEEQQVRLKQELELDLALEIPGTGRCRASIFQQRGTISASFRLVPSVLPEAAGLGLPGALGYFSRLHNGLVLVTGVTGSGKSTTLSVLVDRLNRDRRGRIITIEDPIEYVHKSQRSVVLQREVGQDTHSYAGAVRSVLRQDPDVIVLGELRDRETIAAALTAAETGHLVLSTLHTKSAVDTIQRIVDVFPGEQQSQVRTQLAETLQGVVCQRLLPTADQQSQVLAFEVLILTHPTRTMIREGKLQQIPNQMISGKDMGMCPLDHCLRALLNQGRISYDTALEHCTDVETFDQLTAISNPQLLV